MRFIAVKRGISIGHRCMEVNRNKTGAANIKSCNQEILKKNCVGWELNTDRLLGRQPCWPLHHRCSDSCLKNKYIFCWDSYTHPTHRGFLLLEKCIVASPCGLLGNYFSLKIINLDSKYIAIHLASCTHLCL